MIVFPVVTILNLYRKFDQLENFDFKKQFAESYSNLEIKRGKSVLIVPMLYYFRRFLIPLSVVYNTNITVQMFVMTFSIIAQIIVIGYIKPFAGGVMANALEMFNECVLLLIMYTIICFTDFVPTIEIRFRIGYLSCALIMIHLLVNLTILATVSVKKMFLSTKRFIMLCQYK